MENNGIRVLVAPLDWGLGHATRCIPIIRELIKMNSSVFISASGGGKIILKKEFPGCTFVDIPGLAIRYPAKGSMVFKMLQQVPSILKAILNENKILDKIIDEHKITHVISDNRFGLYSSKAKTAFITHQVKLSGGKKLKFLEPIIQNINKNYIEKFDTLWIPDTPPPLNLSGKLSDATSLKIPFHYIGLLSRFKNEKVISQTKPFDCIALLSGPEPQRSLLEEKLIKHFSFSVKKWKIIQGLPGNKQSENENIQPSISDEDLRNILHPDTLLICRPGYSTVMDLVVLGHKNILFIPTPGQTEQEYLAEHFFHTYGIRYVNQDDEIPGEDEIPKGNLQDFRIGEEIINALKMFLND